MTDEPKNDDGSMYFEMVKITPTMAREWLTLPPLYPPRTLRQNNVAKILHAIENGDWKPKTPHAIALAPDGSVLDGRHRLTAISSQRKHVWAWVAFNSDPDTYDTMDAGRSRSPGDTLKTAGYSDVNVLSAATRQVIAHPELVGTSTTLTAVTKKLTNTDIRKALEDPDIGKHLQEAIRPGYLIARGVGRYGTRTSATVLVAVLNLYSSQGQDTLEEFFGRLGDGEHLGGGSPIMALRKWLIRPDGYGTITPTYRATAFLCVGTRCWNDYVVGQERARVQYHAARDLMPEVS